MSVLKSFLKQNCAHPYRRAELFHGHLSLLWFKTLARKTRLSAKLTAREDIIEGQLDIRGSGIAAVMRVFRRVLSKQVLKTT
jgi:hypothetical protein